MNVGFIDVLIIITVLFNNYYVIYTDFNYCRNEPEVRAIGSTVGCQASWKTCFYKGAKKFRCCVYALRRRRGGSMTNGLRGT